MKSEHAQNQGTHKLGHYDESGFLFVQEMLSGDFSSGINFDSLRKHKEKGYVIFEFLLCEENQKVCPYTSHPNRYWHKNKHKFLRLFELSKVLSATLYLINYAKKGTKHEDRILAIKVLGVTIEGGIVEQQLKKFTRLQFSDWFRKINNESSTTQSNTIDNKMDI